MTPPRGARTIPGLMTPEDAAPATVKLRGDVLAKSVKQAVTEAAAELAAAGAPPRMAVVLA